MQLLARVRHNFIFFVGFGALWALAAPHAQAQDPCPEASIESGLLHATTYSLGKDCVVKIEGPTDRHPSRAYIYRSNGFLSVFNDYATSSEGGSNSKTTAVRSYMIFPRHQKPQVTELGNGDLELTVGAGTRIVFSKETGDFSALPEGSAKFSLAVRRDNGAGLDIRRANTLILDTGIGFGDSSYHQNKNGHSRFIDQNGESCSVSNQELFRYVGRYDASFKYASDAELARFLRARCPNLDLSSLTSTASLAEQISQIDRGMAEARMLEPAQACAP